MTDLFSQIPKGQRNDAKSAPGPVPELANKTCLHPGCKSYPGFGFGRGNKTKWACSEHRAELEEQNGT